MAIEVEISHTAPKSFGTPISEVPAKLKDRQGQFKTEIDNAFAKDVTVLFVGQSSFNVEYTLYSNSTFFYTDEDSILNLALTGYQYTSQINKFKLATVRERAQLVVSKVGIALLQSVSNCRIPNVKQVIVTVAYPIRDFTNQNSRVQGEVVTMVVDLVSLREFAAGKISEDKLYSQTKFFLFEKDGSSSKLVELKPL
jgi:hypothetical protein